MQRNRFSAPASLATLAMASLVAILALAPWNGRPTVLADPSSVLWEVTFDETSDTSSGNGDGIVQAEESPDTVVQVSLDSTPTVADEPFLDMSSATFTGLNPAWGVDIVDGAWVGTMVFSVQSNLSAAAASNVSSVTGQPPVCAAGVSTLGDTLNLFDADLGTGSDIDVHGLGNGVISERDLDGDGQRETEEDNFLEDGSPGSNGLADGIDLAPEALVQYVYRTLGLGLPIGRSFGVAHVATVVGQAVTIDVNLLLFDLGDGEYLTLTILGYPGLPRQQPSGANLTDQTVITCPPFTSTVRLYGVTQDNVATAVVEPAVLQRTATAGTHDYELRVSTRDNYDGDTAASPYDSCADAISIDTDLAPDHEESETEPGDFGDRWDGACDPDPTSSDNDGDTQVSNYAPVTGNWDLDSQNCNQLYITSGGGWDCDQDIDGDTTLNTVDNCPTVPDADVIGLGMEDGTGPVDEPGTGDCSDGADNDEDTFIDGADPDCFAFINWQLDSDADTVGDVCDPAPHTKGDGTGYAVDAHPHGFPGEPGGYGDHDWICNDEFAVPGTEGTGDAGCVIAVDSGNDGDPDMLGETGDTDSDADGDGHTDACEAYSGSDPLDSSSTPGGSAIPGDCDGDGSPDKDEEAQGSSPFAPPTCVDRDGDSSCRDAENDPDDDGCTTAQEATLGDSFLSDAWYDVYDVPVPAVADPGPKGSRNRVVDIGDVLAVLFYAFADEGGAPNANGVSYDSTKFIEPPHDESLKLGYMYDRSPGADPDPVTGVDPAGSPNGAIDIGDVLAVLAQAFVVDCGGS